MEIIVSKITEKVVMIVTVEVTGTVTAAMTDASRHKAYIYCTMYNIDTMDYVSDHA